MKFVVCIESSKVFTNVYYYISNKLIFLLPTWTYYDCRDYNSLHFKVSSSENSFNLCNGGIGDGITGMFFHVTQAQ